MGFFNRNKRGEEIISPEVVFIILSIVVATGFSIFLWNSSNGAFIYEESYAKSIASIINSAKPGSTVLVNLEEPLKVYAKKVFDEKDFRKVMDREQTRNVVAVNNEKKEVVVNLNNKGGYRINYFSDNFVEVDFGNDGILIIRVYDEEVNV